MTYDLRVRLHAPFIGVVVGVVLSLAIVFGR